MTAWLVCGGSPAAADGPPAGDDPRAATGEGAADGEPGRVAAEAVHDLDLQLSLGAGGTFVGADQDAFWPFDPEDVPPGGASVGALLRLHRRLGRHLGLGPYLRYLRLPAGHTDRNPVGPTFVQHAFGVGLGLMARLDVSPHATLVASGRLGAHLSSLRHPDAGLAPDYVLGRGYGWTVAAAAGVRFWPHDVVGVSASVGVEHRRLERWESGVGLPFHTTQATLDVGVALRF